MEPATHDLHPARLRTAMPAPHSRARTSIEESLTGLGISRELACELIEGAAAHVLPLHPRMSLARAVRSALVQRIPVARALPATNATIALVGPGGSGKTSCSAALLGAYRKGSTLPASCATIMLAAEQGIPAMLLSPYIMAPTPIASPYASQALAAAREDGLLLLDMPPLSPAERPMIRTIAALLGQLEPHRVIVALPATLGAKAAAQLLEALRPLRADAVAITHADETDQIGVAVEAACKFGLAPEYLLDRGRVRGGLSRIDPTNLADRLLP
jgi:flagellar biosynthesis GTPase FlhF